MDQPLITVIVPVYKAEAYLEKCVGSIRNQTYGNLEIILVEDGSPDRSGELCDALAREDDRIRVIHKENGGQSSARNAALDVMRGDYVGFVDSDDWVEPDLYERLYRNLIAHSAQISACGVQEMHPDGGISYFNENTLQETECVVYTKMEALRESLRNTKITYSLCDKLFRSDIFAGLRMSVGKIFEDMEIIPFCLEKAETVVYDPRPLYHYNQTEVSTMRGEFNPRKFAAADVALAKAEDYRCRYPELFDEAMAAFIAVSLSAIEQSKGVASCAPKRRELIGMLRAPLDPGAVKALRKNERIKLFALRIGTPAFELLMAVYRLLA